MDTVESLLLRTRPVRRCRIWTGALNSDGYPRIGRKGDANIKVHRLVFYLVHGHYPPVVRHSCDEPRCINPEHLLAGTNLDNIRDRHQRKRSYSYMSSAVRERILRLRHTGMKIKDIAALVGRTYKSVDATLYRARKAG